MFRLSIRSIVTSIAVATLVGTAVVYASPGVSVTTSTAASHSILTDDRGMTLYRYTPDQGGASTCYDACALAWPPLLVDSVPAAQDPSVAQNLGLIQRRDGSQQLTYRNQPLYYFVGDANPGDTNGQASDGVWYVVDGPDS